MTSNASKRTRLIIDVSPRVRRLVKARAALEDMTVREWVLGLIMDELGEEEDIRIALERINDMEGSSSLQELHEERLAMERQGAS